MPLNLAKPPEAQSIWDELCLYLWCVCVLFL